MWGLSVAGSDDVHAFLVVSFVSGTRVLSLSGSAWEDVSDCMGMDTGCGTLAAGVLRAAGQQFSVQARQSAPLARTNVGMLTIYSMR
jgi:hypothetical protein